MSELSTHLSRLPIPTNPFKEGKFALLHRPLSHSSETQQVGLVTLQKTTLPQSFIVIFKTRDAAWAWGLLACLCIGSGGAGIIELSVRDKKLAASSDLGPETLDNWACLFFEKVSPLPPSHTQRASLVFHGDGPLESALFSFLASIKFEFRPSTKTKSRRETVH